MRTPSPATTTAAAEEVAHQQQRRRRALLTTIRTRKPDLPLRSRMMDAVITVYIICCIVSVSSCWASSSVDADDQAAPAAQECSADSLTGEDGSCYSYNDFKTCQLYLAESMVRPGRWGLYAGREFRSQLVLPLRDVAVNVVDFQREDNGDDDSRRSSVLDRYLWDAHHTYSTFDGDRVDAFLPGIGALAQEGQSASAPSGPLSSHLLELHHDSMDRTTIREGNATYGAFSHVHNVQFRVVADTASVEDGAPNIAAGQELLIDPVTKRGVDVDRLGHQGGSSRMEALIRPMVWLQENGVCLDTVETRSSHIVEHQTGAFVTHPVAENHTVAIIPLLVVSRSDLTIPKGSSNRSSSSSSRHKPTNHQLLHNYAYGHPDSSLLLLPLAPAVNLVNHHPHKANVALRWMSSTSSTVPPSIVKFHNDTLLTVPPTQVLQEQLKAGGRPQLVAELYALRPLKVNEELLLDYGAAWQAAFERHQHEWRQQETVIATKSAYEYETDDVVYTRDEPRQYPPDSIQPRCYMDVEAIQMNDGEDGTDDDRWHDFVPIRDDERRIDVSHPCDVVSAQFDQHGDKQSYRVVVSVTTTTIDDDGTEESHTVEYQVKKVPRKAITFVDKPYRGAQYHHQAFRHEIHVPDDMYPPAWRDWEVSPPEETQCGLYMAESAIPHSGLGMYSARSINRNDRIFYGDVVIQVEDYHFNKRLRQVYRGIEDESPSGSWLLNSYYWDPSTTLAQDEADDVQSIVPGLGMLANSHTGLVNAEQYQPNQRGYVLHRAHDVGAGASSSYHDSHFDADKDIETGEEIFVRYGDAWFVDRIEGIPLQADFVKADILVNRFWSLVRGSFMRHRSDALAKDAWDIVRGLTQARDRLASAVPPFEQIETVVKTGTAAHSTPNRIRSIEWLEENGRCLDNIRPGDSTILQAGKGAIATRRIQSGSVIAPVPVVQILRRDLEVYEATEPFDEEDDPLVPSKIKFVGHQLLLNYCFGHKDSSLLLFPYSPVVNYVNHDSNSPNAQLRWSSLSAHHSDWLHRAPEDLAGEPHAGLIMELVATRDILPGEEIFLDYGPDWSQAWNEFQLDWIPPVNATTYVSAAMLNRRREWLLTEDEEERTGSRPNVFTRCYVGRTRVPVEDHAFDDDDDVFEWSYVDGIYEDTDNLLPCQVIERLVEDDELREARGRSESIAPLEVLFTVRVSSDDDTEDPVDTKLFVSVPREAIVFFDRPYTSDLFLRNAFRHEIHLPNEMVPAEWRDMASPS